VKRLLHEVLLTHAGSDDGLLDREQDAQEQPPRRLSFRGGLGRFGTTACSLRGGLGGNRLGMERADLTAPCLPADRERESTPGSDVAPSGLV